MPQSRWRALPLTAPYKPSTERSSVAQSAKILEADEQTPELRVGIRREVKADRINAILNHPVVRPDIADMALGEIDVSGQIAVPENIFLLGEYGACLFFNVSPGIFEVHSACLPEGRGPWMKAFVECVLKWMFTRSNCWEIVTRVPREHLGAKALTVGAGFRLEFSRDDQCVFRSKKMTVDIYRLNIHDWVEKSSWAQELGEIFHSQLHAEADRLKIKAPAHDDDPQHNRIAGASVEMARHGQVIKSVILYCRWAFLARHAPIGLISETPPILKMDIGILHIKPKGIEVAL